MLIIRFVATRAQLHRFVSLQCCRHRKPVCFDCGVQGGVILDKRRLARFLGMM